MVFLVVFDPGTALAAENRVGLPGGLPGVLPGGLPGDGRVVRVPVVKREAAVRKQPKSASGDLKRRLLAPASPLRG